MTSAYIQRERQRHTHTLTHIHTHTQTHRDTDREREPACESSEYFEIESGRERERERERNGERRRDTKRNQQMRLRGRPNLPDVLDCSPEGRTLKRPAILLMLNPQDFPARFHKFDGGGQKGTRDVATRDFWMGRKATAPVLTEWSKTAQIWRQFCPLGQCAAAGSSSQGWAFAKRSSLLNSYSEGQKESPPRT